MHRLKAGCFGRPGADPGHGDGRSAPGRPSTHPAASHHHLERMLVARQPHPVPTIPIVEGARTMANPIPPAAQLFRGLAELIDHDHPSHTHYEAVTKAA